MERRDFFRWGLAKAAGMAVDEVEQRANKSASRWIRPPYAVVELDFLLKCTRCDDCIMACPHEVLFPLGAKFGLQVAATPAMDLLNKGCRMCEDWPCVSACAADALVLPDGGSPEGENVEAENGSEEAVNDDNEAGAMVLPPPKLASVSIDTLTCLPYLGPECGACAGSCPVPGALYWGGPKPKIDQSLCTGCGMCRESCIVDPKAVLLQTLGREKNDSD